MLVTNCQNSRQRGFGLIELMVSIAIGLIVVGGITSLVVATLRTNTDNYRMTRLTQDLRSSMTLISRELRRAGYDRDAVYDFGRGGHVANNFEMVRLFDSNGNELQVENGIGTANPATCIIYGWDENGNGTGDPGEFRGFRLDGNDNVLEMKMQGGEGDASCGTGPWEDLTDPELIQIDNFAITTVNGAPAPTVTDSAGNPILTVRELVVRLEGSVTGDDSMTRKIEETIRVRNDLFN